MREAVGDHCPSHAIIKTGLGNFTKEDQIRKKFYRGRSVKDELRYDVRKIA